MLVNRVGKTLLIDDLDVSRLAQATAGLEWTWLREFFFNVVLRCARYFIFLPLTFFSTVDVLRQHEAKGGGDLFMSVVLKGTNEARTVSQKNLHWFTS